MNFLNSHNEHECSHSFQRMECSVESAFPHIELLCGHCFSRITRTRNAYICSHFLFDDGPRCSFPFLCNKPGCQNSKKGTGASKRDAISMFFGIF